MPLLRLPEPNRNWINPDRVLSVNALAPDASRSWSVRVVMDGTESNQLVLCDSVEAALRVRDEIAAQCNGTAAAPAEAPPLPDRIARDSVYHALNADGDPVYSCRVSQDLETGRWYVRDEDARAGVGQEGFSTRADAEACAIRDCLHFTSPPPAVVLGCPHGNNI